MWELYANDLLLYYCFQLFGCVQYDKCVQMWEVP